MSQRQEDDATCGSMACCRTRPQMHAHFARNGCVVKCPDRRTLKWQARVEAVGAGTGGRRLRRCGSHRLQSLRRRPRRAAVLARPDRQLIQGRDGSSGSELGSSSSSSSSITPHTVCSYGNDANSCSAQVWGGALAQHKGIKWSCTPRTARGRSTHRRAGRPSCCCGPGPSRCRSSGTR